MSDDGVHPFEMNAPNDFDDAAAEALLAGSGRDVDSALADAVADMRIAFTSSPPPAGPALAAFLAAPAAPADSFSRRFERMKSSTMAKIGAATAAVVAATGGLAMASALPAPVQDAVSHLGVGAPAHHHGHHTDSVEAVDDTTVEPTSTTVAESTTVPGDTSTTVAVDENHGKVVSGVAHDPELQGCEHGRAVAAVASDGRAQDKPCPTTTTTLGDSTTSTTVADDDGDSDHGKKEEHAVTTTPTSVESHGNDNAGSDHGKSADHSGSSSGGGNSSNG